nr:uracil-DNA glycosylase [Mariprofundus sp. KV]
MREIGVQTPVSLFTSGPRISAAESAAASASTQSASTRPAAEQAAIVELSAMPEGERSETNSGTLAALAEKAATCRLCGLAETRTQVVFGVGNPNADIVFIGEAPGRDEDAKGEPFVGRAGQLLDRMLAAIDLDRDRAYIMNTIKCRPPNNRDPRMDEVQSCNLWFEQQLELLQPKMICLLGRVAAQTVLETDAPLGSLRGQWHDYQGIPVWVTYHPAYLLRSPAQKQKSWLDLQALASRYNQLNS